MHLLSNFARTPVDLRTCLSCLLESAPRRLLLPSLPFRSTACKQPGKVVLRARPPQLARGPRLRLSGEKSVRPHVIRGWISAGRSSARVEVVNATGVAKDERHAWQVSDSLVALSGLLAGAVLLGFVPSSCRRRLPPASRVRAGANAARRVRRRWQATLIKGSAHSLNRTHSLAPVEASVQQRGERQLLRLRVELTQRNPPPSNSHFGPSTSLSRCCWH